MKGTIMIPENMIRIKLDQLYQLLLIVAALFIWSEYDNRKSKKEAFSFGQIQSYETSCIFIPDPDFQTIKKIATINLHHKAYPREYVEGYQSIIELVKAGANCDFLQKTVFNNRKQSYGEWFTPDFVVKYLY